MGIGGFFSGVSSWFKGLPGWGKLLIQVGATVGLDAIAALMNQPAHREGARLKDLQYSSSAYGDSIPRCRGTMRCPGNVIWGTPIVETKHESDGETTYTYSVSLAIAFARGPAERFLTVWTDGKRLFSSQVTNASKTGSVTVHTAARTGALTVELATGSSSSLSLEAGAIIQFPDDPGVDYQVQNALEMGASEVALVSIWPALANDVAATGVVAIPGLQGPTWDEAAFKGVSSSNAPSIGAGTFYLGTETQSPDPTIVAAQGADRVPAYRGLVYLVLKNLQLQNFGNRIPMFSAEVAFDPPTSAFPFAGPIVDAAGTETPIGDAASGDTLLIPGENIGGGLAVTTPRYVYLLHNTTALGAWGAAELIRINAETNREVSRVYIPKPACRPVIDYEGFIYIQWASSLNHFRVDKYDAASGDWIDGVPHGAWESAPGGVGARLWFGPYSEMYLVDRIGSTDKLLVCAGQWGGFDVFNRAWIPPTFDIINWAVGYTVGAAWDIIEYAAGLTIKAAGLAYLSTRDTVDHGYGIYPPRPAIDRNGGLWYGQRQNLVAPDETVYDMSAEVSTYIWALYYNPGDHTITVGTQGKLVRVDCLTGAILGRLTYNADGLIPLTPIAVDALGTILLAGDTRSTDGASWFRVQLASIVDGADPVITTYNATDFFALVWGTITPVSPSAIYDQTSGSIWFGNDGKVYRVYIDRGRPGEIALGDVFAWLCDEAGLDSSEYDTTLVTGSVGGVRLEREAVRDSLLTLMPLGPHDGAEIDGKLVFVPRGGTPVVTIPEDDLGALDSLDRQEARLSEVLQQESETPMRVSLKYYDQGRQHQQATQDARRISQPYASDLVGGRKVTHTRQELSLTLPVAWSATPARQAAERILFDAWAGRFSYSWKLPPKYLRLDPTDVVAISYKGQTLEARLTQAERGAGLALQLAGQSHDAGVYVSNATGATGGQPAPITQAPPTSPPGLTAAPQFLVNGS